MSRVVCPFLLQLLVLFIAHQVISAVTLEDCKDFDVLELESYLSRLNLRDVPSVRSMTGGFKCPINALPFGALKSDWARLLLLQDAQPKESTLRPKLDQLFRILAVAYYQMEEKFDIVFDRVISKDFTENPYKSTEEHGGSRIETSTENIVLTKKEYPLDGLGQIVWRKSNVTVAEKQEDLESSIFPGGSSTIATSYRDPMEKMRRPQISRKPPTGMNEFWNYVLIPKRVVSPATLASIGPLSASGRGDEVTVLRGDDITSATHANLNSNAQKIFRWFYNPDRGIGFDNELITKSEKEAGCRTGRKGEFCCS